MEKNWIWAILVVVGFNIKCESALTTFGRADPLPLSTTTEQPLTKVYHVYTEFTANWYRAYHYCVQNNMQLATIDTLNEFNHIQKQIGETKFTDNFWIGLTKLGNPKFYWFGYKKPVTFSTYFANSECANCSCGSVSTGKGYWSANSCDELSYFVCESSLSD